MYERLPREEWTALIPNAHAGYITWDDFEDNQRRLRENAQANGSDRRRSPPREGPALLQGLAVCGICGDRMTVRYHRRHGTVWPTYVCQRQGIARAEPICQSIPGRDLDDAIGRVLLETVTPLTLEIALTVQQELQTRLDETDRLHRRAVERARYEADLARRRYLQVDPANRLVADELEAHWNRASGRSPTRRRPTSGNDKPTAWPSMPRPAHGFSRSRATSPVMARSAYARSRTETHGPPAHRRFTLIKTANGVTAHLRFRGGATTTLTLPSVRNAGSFVRPEPAIVALIDQLLDTHADQDIATILNARGYVSGTGQPFQRGIVKHLRHSHGLRSRYERLRERGMLTRDEIARRLKVSAATVKVWGQHGLLPRAVCNDKGEWPMRRQARPPSKCRADVYLTADPVTSSPIGPMRCSMKRSPSARASEARSDGREAERGDESAEGRIEGRVTVVQQESCGGITRESIAELLSSPLGRGMLRHVDLQDAAAVVGEDDEDEQDPAGEGRHAKKSTATVEPRWFERRCARSRGWRLSPRHEPRTVRSETANPSFNNSPWMRGAPESGFATATSRSAAERRRRPVAGPPRGRDRRVQGHATPRRCHAMTVAGWTTTRRRLRVRPRQS